MELDLDGNVALVTGSATGLGHACAEAFSRQGANVVLASPDLGELAYASDRLYALGDGEILGLEVDVRRPDGVAALVEEAVEEYGGIDHVVTGPRPIEPGEFLAVADEDWFRAFDRQFMSVVWTIREAHPYLADADRGTVVAVTNPVIRALSGEFPVANAFGRAIRGIVESQARALAPEVRLNAVCPGPHATADLDRFVDGLLERGIYDDPEAARAALLADCPCDAPGDPLALGRLVAVLSSEHAGFVNGATIPVDGGSGG